MAINYQCVRDDENTSGLTSFFRRFFTGFPVNNDQFFSVGGEKAAVQPITPA
jgi:hypothetical protein